MTTFLTNDGLFDPIWKAYCYYLISSSFIIVSLPLSKPYALLIIFISLLVPSSLVFNNFIFNYVLILGLVVDYDLPLGLLLVFDKPSMNELLDPYSSF